MYEYSLRGKRRFVFIERARGNREAGRGSLPDPFVCAPPRNFFLRPNRPFPSLCIKTRLSVQPLIWKWFFILMKMKLIFTRKVVHLAPLWKWGFLEFGNGLLKSRAWYACQHLLLNWDKHTNHDLAEFFKWPCRCLNPGLSLRGPVLPNHPQNRVFSNLLETLWFPC